MTKAQKVPAENSTWKATVAIRVDASTRMGSGHVMRCLTLASKLISQNLRIIFLTKNHQGNLNHLIEQQGFELIKLSAPVESIEAQIDDKLWLGCSYQADAQECLHALTGLNIHLLIIDHYSLDHQWQAILKDKLNSDLNKQYSTKFMVIDDLANRKHHCDILLDQTLGRIPQDYKELTPHHCQLLLGNEFIMLRDEFEGSRMKAESIREKTSEIKNILITMGGTDPDNIAESVLNWLIKFQKLNSNIQITLVANKTSTFFDKLKLIACNHKWISIVSNPQSMANLMLKAEVAIGSSGATAWERCCLGLPCISIISADNQQFLSEKLSNAGAIISLGHFSTINYTSFIKAITQILIEKDTYTNMVKNCFACCDGLGVNKVITAILDNISNDTSLIEANYDDCQVLFDWQSNIKIRKYFNNPKPVEWKKHCQWLSCTLDDADKYLYMIKLNNPFNETAKPIGMLRLDLIKHSQCKIDAKWEISIIIDPDYQGKKIAAKAISKIPYSFLERGIIAQVHNNNIASHKLFLRAGFKQISETVYCIKLDANLGVNNG